MLIYLVRESLKYQCLKSPLISFLVGSRTQIIKRSCRSSRKLGHGAEWYRIRNSTKWTKPRIGRLSNSQNYQKYLWKRIKWFRTNKVSNIFSLVSQRHRCCWRMLETLMSVTTSRCSISDADCRFSIKKCHQHEENDRPHIVLTHIDPFLLNLGYI